MFPRNRWGAALAFGALILSAAASADSVPSPAEQFAANLIAARSQQARNRLLDENRDLLTQDLQDILLTRGDSVQKTGDYTLANRIYEISGEVAARRDDFCGQADALNKTGISFEFQSDFDQALTYLNKALEMGESHDCRLSVATSLRNIGWTYDNQGKLDLSESTLRRSLAIYESQQNSAGISRVLMDLGILMEDLNDFDTAMENYQKALTIARTSGNQILEAIALNNIAVNYDLRGNNELALEYYNQALALNRKLKNDSQLSNNLINIGSVYQSRGDYIPALHYIEEALGIQRRLKMKKAMAYSLSNIGQIYAQQGDYDLALYYFQMAQSLFVAARLNGGVASALSNAGQVYALQGKFEKATSTLRASLQIQRELKDTHGMMNALCNLGDVYHKQQRLDQALQNYNECLRLGDQAPLANLKSNALLGIAEVLIEQSKYGDALQYAGQSSDLARTGGYLDVLWQSETSKARCYLALKQPGPARQALLQAIDVLEAQRKSTAGGEEESQRFFQTRTSPYELMVELSLSEGEIYDALAYSERSKARVLLDVLHGGRARINAAMNDTERKKEQALSERIYLLNSQLQNAQSSGEADEKKVADLKSSLDQARLDLKDFESQLYSTHRELMVQRGDAPILSREDAGALSADPRTVLLEYAYGEKKVYLFVLAQGGLKVIPLPIPKDRLTIEAEKLHDEIAGRTLGYQQEARSLYRSLIQPAAEQIKNAEALIIVPDGGLWNLPFQALLSPDGSYLLQKYAVSYAPSLTVLREMRSRENPLAQAPAVLAFANPLLGKETVGQVRQVFRNQSLDPLPEADAEVNALKQIYGSSSTQVYHGAKALESAFKHEIARYDIVHLATHGIVNSSNPLYSYLLFSRSGPDDPEDGLLEAWEIMKLPLKARLVVLSACDTARGRVGAGEGMIGLSWAFFVAGCPSSVVSQWKVETLSTSLLMQEFHRNVKSSLSGNGSGESRAQALRKAALALMKNEKYRHPFYWASFILIGDPS